MSLSSHCYQIYVIQINLRCNKYHQMINFEIKQIITLLFILNLKCLKNNIWCTFQIYCNFKCCISLLYLNPSNQIGNQISIHIERIMLRNEWWKNFNYTALMMKYHQHFSFYMDISSRCSFELNKHRFRTNVILLEKILYTNICILIRLKALRKYYIFR